KKFYGPEQGNKLANIRKIFEANRKTLKSIDEVVVGQKILIPPLKTSGPDVKKTESVFAGSLFEEVKSIGRRLLSGDKPEPEPKPEPKPQPKPRPQYVVKDGDNLWRVARAQLGDGTRYKEIVKLNPDVLKSENTTLDIGMRLRLPAQ
ncbi:MAG: LysM peptidoglycan-binding domain-containing protein, partial [Planctomycetota bacterium]